MTNRDQKKPNCPKCGKYTAARGRIKRRACEPFCTVRCAAAYGRSQFSEDPCNVWDVQSRSWVDPDDDDRGNDDDNWEQWRKASKYLYIREGFNWQRREPKRWHSKEDE